METRTETKKIAIGCFVGGFIGTAVALICAPIFWWLGMLAGFGAGYLCYDLKEIREAVPVAWKTAKKGSGHALTCLVKPHPFLWLHMIIFSLLLRGTLSSTVVALTPSDGKLEDIFPIVVLNILLSLLVSLVLTTALGALAETAALARKCFWEGHPEFFFIKPNRNALLQQNYRRIPATYKNIYGLMAKGLMDKLAVAAEGIRIGVPALLGFLFRDMWVLIPKFLWTLFKLIHSQKRVLCGIDSAIGTAIAYFSLGIHAATPVEKVMVVICGGIIGAVIGILNFEIVSKRILRLTPA